SRTSPRVKGWPELKGLSLGSPRLGLPPTGSPVFPVPLAQGVRVRPGFGNRICSCDWFGFLWPARNSDRRMAEHDRIGWQPLVRGWLRSLSPAKGGFPASKRGNRTLLGRLIQGG